MARSREIDMTNGPLVSKVVQFAIPLALSSMLQLLFNAADVIVVGQFAGSTALAAVGSTGALVNLLVNVFMGVSIGANVMVARARGAGDYKAVHETVHCAMLISVILGAIVAVLGFCVSGFALTLMGSPADVKPLATLYLKIYFLGMPANLVYNFGAAILRAIGDTKRPLYILTAAGVANVLLNLVLVIVFHMGVAGVAIATVFSQCISAVLVVLCLLNADGAYKLYPADLRIHKDKLIGMVRIGLQVSEILKRTKTEAGVVNCSSIKPLDEEYLKQMDPHVPVITLEEHMTTGGFGEYVTEKCRMLGIAEPADCIGVPDRFIAHGSHDRLLEDAGLSPEKIAERIRNVLGRINR